MRPIHRRCRVDHLNLHINDLAGKWQMNWMPSKVKSLSQNVGAFVISNGSFTEVYPQPDHKSSSTADSLQRFCDDVGVPINLKTDRAKEFVDRMTYFRKLVKKRHINMTYAEPERKNQIPGLILRCVTSRGGGTTRCGRRMYPRGSGTTDWCTQARSCKSYPGRNYETGRRWKPSQARRLHLKPVFRQLWRYFTPATYVIFINFRQLNPSTVTGDFLPL